LGEGEKESTGGAKKTPKDRQRSGRSGTEHPKGNLDPRKLGKNKKQPKEKTLREPRRRIKDEYQSQALSQVKRSDKDGRERRGTKKRLDPGHESPLNTFQKWDTHRAGKMWEQGEGDGEKSNKTKGHLGDLRSADELKPSKCLSPKKGVKPGTASRGIKEKKHEGGENWRGG